MIKGTAPFLQVLLALLIICIMASAHAAITLTDDTGHQVSLAHPAKRIVSLAPGLTELVFDAGAGRRLVGAVASAYNFPPAARKVPSVGDAFHMDMEKIAALHPDLVLAWRGSTPKRAQERLRQLGFTVATLGAERLRQIAGDLLMIGRATGRERAAKAKANAYLSGLAKLRQAYARRTPVSVFYEISAEPLFSRAPLAGGNDCLRIAHQYRFETDRGRERAEIGKNIAPAA
jgi:iron complex transport system substrate-binding protein